MKSSSIFQNASLYGMPYPVEGGTEIVYSYEVHIMQGNQMWFIGVDENHRCIITEKPTEATRFTKDAASQICSLNEKTIMNKFPGAKITIVPVAHYETIRNKY